jgi:hypothetical protein
MRLWMVSLVAVAAVFLGAWVVYAQPAAPSQTGAARSQQEAVYQCPMHPDVKATWPAKCPKCGMTLQKVSDSSGVMDMMPMHEGQGGQQMPMQDMMARHLMLMMTQVSKTDPAALLSIRDKLKLTDEQVGKLESLARETGQKAQALLSDDQRKTLSTIPDEPTSMMAMCSQMMSMVGGGTMGGSMGMTHGMGQKGAGQAH